MDEEVLSQLENVTREPVTLPPEEWAIGCRWVYVLKTDEWGNPVRYKAWLSRQKCSQMEGIDYEETWAPTSKWTTLRVLW